MIKFSKEKVLLLHQLIAEETGGSVGVRDEGLLESALEAAFDVLGIEENYIKLIDFCKMWEDNDRECWAMNSTEPFNGITADIHYKAFKEDYELWQKNLEFLYEDG